MTMHRPVVFRILALTVFFSAVAGISGCSRSEAPPQKEVVRPARLMTVSRTGESLRREFPGEVRAGQRVDLAFQVSGPLVQLPVKEGQQVKKGDLLARIQPRDYQTALDAAQADARAAEQNYNRFKQLYIRKQISKAEFDGAKRAYDVAKAQVDRARNMLEDTRLVAPFSGVIAKTFVENFQEVTMKQPIVSLQDVSDLEILVNLPEIFMSRLRDVRVGETAAAATFPAAPDRAFPLVLKKFETQADPHTRTYQVVLGMKAPTDMNILPGMTATVTGKTSVEEMTDMEAFLVPVEAVFADASGKQFVWVVAPDTMTAEKREVAVGAVSGTSIQVLTGLASGETIITAGVHFVQPGMKVWDMRAMTGGRS